VSVVDARRRAFAACLAGAALAPGRVLAQPSDRIPRVGLLVAETVAGSRKPCWRAPTASSSDAVAQVPAAARLRAS
jgi:hypothetical protein